MSVAENKTVLGSPTDKAIRKDKWTEILFRALSNRVAKRWRFVSFRGAKGGEFCGVVDIIAIRKDTAKSDDEVLRMGDLFEIILVQMKGGSADMPTHDDIQRLKAVAKRYHAKEIVLFEWRQREPKKNDDLLLFSAQGQYLESVNSRRYFRVDYQFGMNNTL